MRYDYCLTEHLKMNQKTLSKTHQNPSHDAFSFTQDLSLITVSLLLCALCSVCEPRLQVLPAAWPGF